MLSADTWSWSVIGAVNGGGGLPSGALRILGIRSMVVKTLPIALEALVMSAFHTIRQQGQTLPELGYSTDWAKADPGALLANAVLKPSQR